MFVIRKRLYPQEGLNPDTRYDPTCDCVQSTWDGGTTWYDNPAADPRTSPAFVTPASNDRCDAAQGISNFVRKFIDDSLQAFSIVGISSTAISIGLLFLPPLAMFYRVAWIVAEGIIGVGEVTLQAVFTETVYDQIRDIAFCHLNDDGKFDDQAAFDRFGAQLQEDIGGSAFNIVMALMFNLYGWVGFSNAAIEFAEGADCSGAVCQWCYNWQDAELGTWSPVVLSGVPFAVWSSDRWTPHFQNDACNDHAYVYIDKTYGSTYTFNSVSFTLAVAAPSGFTTASMQLYLGATLVGIGSATSSDGGLNWGYNFGGIDADRMVIATNVCNNASGYSIVTVEARGTGDNPEGDDNC